MPSLRLNYCLSLSPTSRMVRSGATTSEEDPSLLAIVVETNATTWAALERQLPPLLFQRVLDSVLAFANAFLSCRHDNAIAVIAADRTSSHLIYTNESDRTPTGPPESSDVPSSAYLRHWLLGNTVSNRIREIFRGQQSADGQDVSKSSGVALAGALSLALSYINKLAKVRELASMRSRVLVLSVSTDSPEQYIPLMNCFFAAQKLGIPIDVCRLRTEDSIMLQQAASISNGIYLNVDESNMLQSLLFAFLPDHYSRGFLRPIGNRNVDFRATCFCHRRVIDIGYVCSVCLSIFCEPEKDVCSTCGTRLSAGNARGTGR